MNVLVLGASGFIGNALFHALAQQHNVTIACRNPIDGYTQWKHVDLTTDNDWESILNGIELVVNAIGIIEGDLQQVQTTAPLQLYKHCVTKNISVIHISAIGAEKENPPTEFLRTKKQTDDFLISYDKARVVYPGVVLGTSGRSSQFFAEMAGFPVIPLLSKKPVSFVHINQLCGLVNKMVSNMEQYPKQVFAVAQPESLKAIMNAIKGKKGLYVKMPRWPFKLLFALFPKINLGILNKNTFLLLNEITPEDYEPMFSAVSPLLKPGNLTKSSVFPYLSAIAAIAFIWIFSGVASLISWDTSYALMQEIGANHQLSVLLIWLGSLADILLGIAVFSKKYRKGVILLQVLTMLAYMAILTIATPHYWMHPFGVLAKNIPLLALSYYVYRKS